MSTIDELMDIMDKDRKEWTKKDTAELVAYHRAKRAERETGVRTKPKKETGPDVGLDNLRNILKLKSSKPQEEIKRRI